jgi:regulator of ribonuclease activity A
MKISTPDLCDAYADDVRVCELPFRSFGGRASFRGQVVTVKCFEDNSLVKATLADPGDGRVLVVDGGGSLRRALLGDQVATLAVQNGWAGVVVYGAVRDVDELRVLDLGIKALGCVPLKTEKRGEGCQQVEVRFGGVNFTPGEYLAADSNGLIVSSRVLAPIAAESDAAVPGTAGPKPRGN